MPPENDRCDAFTDKKYLSAQENQIREALQRDSYFDARVGTTDRANLGYGVGGSVDANGWNSSGSQYDNFLPKCKIAMDGEQSDDLMNDTSGNFSAYGDSEDGGITRQEKKDKENYSETQDYGNSQGEEIGGYGEYGTALSADETAESSSIGFEYSGHGDSASAEPLLL